MTDLELVERFRDDLPAADPAALSRARARMFHEPAPARRRARWVWGLAPAGALAAAVAIAVAAGGVAHPRTPPRHDAAPASAKPAKPQPSQPEPSKPEPSKPGTPKTATDAAGVLRLAAEEVRAEPVIPAKPGQFVYAESIDASDNVENLETKPTWVPPKEIDRKIWQSVDGAQDGLLIQTVVRTGKKYHVPLEADGTRAYLTDLPTDPVAMRAWLYAVGPGTRQPENQTEADFAAWDKMGETLREKYVAPLAKAAMFEAAATIPGTTMVKGADLAGRKGIAVSRSDRTVRFDYVFDAKTYEFLGERVVVVGKLPPYPKGVVSRWTAQLKVAIVDRAGQLP
jgi:hypothetical protein